MSNQKFNIPIGLSNVEDTYSVNKFFEEYVFQKEYYPYQFDGWKEKQLYGLVDNSGRSIYPKTSLLRGITNDNGITHDCLFFVAEAFDDMKKYHKSFLLSDKASPIRTIYSGLEVQRGADELDTLYIDYANKLYNTFLRIPIQKFQANGTIKNFSTFTKIFIDYIKTIASIAPINRSTFIKNRACHQNINGLIISLQDIRTTADSRLKANNYMSDPNFDFFVESAKRYGFFVDRNAPWRIVADLASPVMQDYYKKYNFNSVDDVFANCYHIAYLTDLKTLRNLLISFWNSFVSVYPVSISGKQQENCSSIFVEVNNLKPINEKVFESHYNINWLLRLYLFIKIHEYNIIISQNVFENIYNEAININKFVDTENCLDYINKKIDSLTKKINPNTLRLTSPEEMARIISSSSDRYLNTEGVNF